MVDAPEKWCTRGWFARSSRLGLLPDAATRAAHAFGPYARSALAELNAPLKTETAPPARSLRDSPRLSARLDEVDTGHHAEPQKKSPPILAPRGTLPFRPETKSGAHRAEDRLKVSKTIESVAGVTSSNSETKRADAEADRWRTPITVK
ncbi:MAG TPA: hypothetical protein PK857_04350 [Hyphomicrobium sp.]|nr:hypothetical protein [Hyphomicrobium sp.]HRO50754.1 hypothetical protein [Hyphomicrobium sp.]